mmetsp:Transcript_29589/g.55374  ORF Transcript_29589/g.55374 Transcript_29589/m.55374 type:complete len:285 (+) Transcript_29589:106-960(+)
MTSRWVLLLLLWQWQILVCLCARRGADEEMQPLKLVINSNAQYAKPRETLLRSLQVAKFENYTDVIIVIGGSAYDKVHQLDGITMVETKFMSFDLTALSMLWHHRHHPWIKAKAYIYLLDTMTVGLGFPGKFEHYAFEDPLGPSEFRSPPRLSSNICMFGRGVVESYQTNFDTNLTKQDVLWFEHGHEPRGVKLLASFATEARDLRARIEHGDALDVYETGYPRRVFWYPDLDVYKYILWERSGDFQGQILTLPKVHLKGASDSVFQPTKNVWQKVWFFFTGSG